MIPRQNWNLCLKFLYHVKNQLLNAKKNPVQMLHKYMTMLLVSTAELDQVFKSKPHYLQLTNKFYL